MHAILNGLLILLALPLLTFCGKAENESELQDGQSKVGDATLACAFTQSQVTVRLGQTVTTQVKVMGATSKVAVARTKLVYTADTSGGMTFEADVVPISRLSNTRTQGADLSYTISRSYAVKADLPNQETNYAKQFPGTLRETIWFKDADGNTAECGYKVTLQP